MITIYGFPECPYYIKAVQHSKKYKNVKNIPIERKNWSNLLKKLNLSSHTSPIVYKGSKLIGGCDDFTKMKSKKKSNK